MLQFLKNIVVREILQLLHQQQLDYRIIRDSMVVGSIEWKYYQGKINALTDLEYNIIDKYNLKIKKHGTETNHTQP